MIEIIARPIEAERKIKNKLTGKIKSYMAFETIDGNFFIQLAHTDYSVFKTFPKFLYEIVEDNHG